MLFRLFGSLPQTISQEGTLIIYSYPKITITIRDSPPALLAESRHCLAKSVRQLLSV